MKQEQDQFSYVVQYKFVPSGVCPGRDQREYVPDGDEHEPVTGGDTSSITSSLSLILATVE